jgi:probable rRNA maturation factor
MTVPDSDSGYDIAVAVRAGDWRNRLPDAPEICRRAAHSALVVAGIGDVAAELGIVLGDDDLVAGYNREWRNEAGPTNVLSFPVHDLVPGAPLQPAGFDAPVLLGDVVVALERTSAEAAAAGIALSDHVSHLVIHGVLHLLGHDHEADDQAEKMEALEISALSRLGVANPLARAHALVP